MREKGSYIAGYIDQEYRRRKAYEKKNRRVNCKIRDCDKCQFKLICEEEKDDT